MGMNVDEVAVIAVEGLRRDAFYVLVPESAARAAKIGERAEALRSAVRMARHVSRT